MKCQTIFRITKNKPLEEGKKRKHGNDTMCTKVKLLSTPIRRLEGITYWLIEDPDGIHDFVNNEIRREWEQDARFKHREPERDPWLKTLAHRSWRLETMDLTQIGLNPETMNYADLRTSYTFSESLARRRAELQESIKTYAAVIWPLIVRQEDKRLVDCYCRHAALKEMRVSKTYAYTGTLQLAHQELRREMHTYRNTLMPSNQTSIA